MLIFLHGRSFRIDAQKRSCVFISVPELGIWLFWANWDLEGTLTWQRGLRLLMVPLIKAWWTKSNTFHVSSSPWNILLFLCRVPACIWRNAEILSCLWTDLWNPCNKMNQKFRDKNTPRKAQVSRKPWDLRMRHHKGSGPRPKGSCRRSLSPAAQAKIHVQSDVFFFVGQQLLAVFPTPICCDCVAQN